MRKPRNSVTPLQAILVSLIGIVAPCLYGQCITSVSCTDWTPGATIWCSGSNPQQGMSYGPNAYWLAGSNHCGELFLRGEDTGNQCGQGIATSCA